MSRRIVSMTRGRPGPRRPRPSSVLAISYRCQRRRVSGVTRVCRSRRTRRPRRVACAARRRRWASVNRRRPGPRCSRRTRFSSWRVNDVTLLLVDPARDGHDEELQHLGNRRQTGRAEQRLSAVTNVATRRASSVESARRTASIGFLDSTGSRARACHRRVLLPLLMVTVAAHSSTRASHYPGACTEAVFTAIGALAQQFTHGAGAHQSADADPRPTMRQHDGKRSLLKP